MSEFKELFLLQSTVVLNNLPRQYYIKKILNARLLRFTYISVIEQLYSFGGQISNNAMVAAA
jgi:hypothetical protein